MAGIGHNSGRVEEAGRAWRTHVWRRARANLMPRLPIEVVRRRVKRAAELGLPYKTYAGIRASTGHDLIGFMFSSNAMRVFKNGQAVPADRAAVVDALQSCTRIGLTHPPIHVSTLVPPLDRAFMAPAGQWSDVRNHMATIIRDIGQPADRFVLVGETGLEREWAGAIRMAGYLSGGTYFS